MKKGGWTARAPARIRGGAAWLSGPIPEWRGAKGRQENGKPAANRVDLAAPAFRKHKKKGFLGEIVIFSNAG